MIMMSKWLFRNLIKGGNIIICWHSYVLLGYCFSFCAPYDRDIHDDYDSASIELRL